MERYMLASEGGPRSLLALPRGRSGGLTKKKVNASREILPRWVGGLEVRRREAAEIKTGEVWWKSEEEICEKMQTL